MFRRSCLGIICLKNFFTLETETDRQTEETDRYIKKERQIDRQREETDILTKRETDRHIKRETDRERERDS